jgi:hypothetical protein
LGKETVMTYPFSSYASRDLLKVFALLLVQPRNHGKNIRLEQAILEALWHINLGTQESNIANLRSDLLKYCQPHPFEDPPEEFFTELLYWRSGNHLVFPGIAANGVEIVQQLLTTIWTGDNFPQPFLEEVEPVINFLLTIHTRIALALNYTPRLFEDEHHRPLFIPEESLLRKQKNIFSFQVEAMSNMLKEFGLTIQTFNSFVFDGDKQKLQFEDPDDNPLFQRPFILMGDEYILFDPTAELFCLNDHILASARKHSCLEILLDSYRDIAMIELYPIFSRIEWKRIQFSFPDDESLPKSCLWTELLFEVDFERLVYVAVATEIPASESNRRKAIEDYSDELKTRVEKTCELIKKQFPAHQILFLNVTHKSRILSKVGLHLNLLRNVDFQLFFSYTELLLLTRKWDFDNLTLWKYGKYLHEFENKHGFAPYNTHFSKMKWYMDHEESFYHSDKVTPSTIFFAFEIESEVRRSAVQLLDKKAIRYWSNGVISFVPCYRKEKYYPVYISQDINQGLIASCLQEYDFPIWCVSSRKSDFHGDIYINGILYWLHEMFPLVKGWMNQLGETPVLIRVTFDKRFYEMPRVFTITGPAKPDFRYKLTPDERLIDVFLPITLHNYLCDSGNRGEYLLMNFVIDVIGELQERLDVGERLTDDVKDKIFREIMPDGPKKFINTITDYRDLTLSNVDIPTPRSVPKADVSYVLQNQVKGLNRATPVPDKILEPPNQTTLLNELVTYNYQEVKDAIIEYDGLQLLIFLMRRHEAVLQNHSFQQVNYPVKQACYGRYYNVFEEFYQQAKEGNLTNLALRILIEWVTCWMPNGGKLPSDDDIDMLLAHVSEVLNYGSLSDEIWYGLRQVEIGLLPSGRLGINRSKNSSSYNTITDKVFGAEYESYGEKFIDYFDRPVKRIPDPDYVKYVDKVENVFRKEWGIGIHDIFILTNALVQALFDKGRSVILVSKNELNALLVESKFTSVEIEAWMNILRFIKRNDVLKAPDGFKNEEVYPWRYNRRISYLLKPLIFIEREGEEYLLLSARHIYKATENLVSIFHSGKLPLDKENKAIRALLAERNAINGKEYRDEVYKWLTNHTGLHVYQREITIRKKGVFVADTDKGDIDILAIDHDQKIIYSIECKNTGQSKVAYEFHLEIMDYLGKPGKNGLIRKHVNRDQWLRDNLEQVLQKLKVEADYRLISLVISNHVLPTAILRTIPLPTISFYELKKFGLPL